MAEDGSELKATTPLEVNLRLSELFLQAGGSSETELRHFVNQNSKVPKYCDIHPLITEVKELRHFVNQNSKVPKYCDIHPLITEVKSQL